MTDALVVKNIIVIHVAAPMLAVLHGLYSANVQVMGILTAHQEPMMQDYGIHVQVTDTNNVLRRSVQHQTQDIIGTVAIPLVLIIVSKVIVYTRVVVKIINGAIMIRYTMVAMVIIGTSVLFMVVLVVCNVKDPVDYLKKGGN